MKKWGAFFRRHGIWIFTGGVIFAVVILYAVAPPLIIQNRLPAGTFCPGERLDSEVATEDTLLNKFEHMVFRNNLLSKKELDFVFKWNGQILVDARELPGKYGDYLALAMNQLSCLTGLNVHSYDPALKLPPNYYIWFVTPDRFDQEVLKYKINKNPTGQIQKVSFCFSLGQTPLGRKRIMKEIVFINDISSPKQTRRCLMLTFAKSLGLFGYSGLIEKSIFTTKAPKINYLTLNDKILLRTLYDKRIKPGMARDEAMKIAAEIIPELVKALKAKGVEALFQH